MVAGEVFADREHRYGRAPRWAVFLALTDRRARWLGLRPGEVMPTVLEADPETRVVWSSFWPVSPADTIELDLRDDEAYTAVRFRWWSSTPPDDRGIAITRLRLNERLGDDLRGWLVSKESVAGGPGRLP